jgi:hypothetical protein
LVLLLNFIKKNGTAVFKSFQEIMVSIYSKSKIAPKEINYNNLSDSEIRALLLNEQYNLEYLLKEKKGIEAKNYEGYNVIYWSPPSKISQERLKKWNEILSKVKTFDKNIFLSQNPELFKTRLVYNSYISELNKIRHAFMRDYTLEVLPGLSDINKQISNVQKKKNELEKMYLQREYTRLETERRRVYGKMPPNIPQRNVVYPEINERLVTEVVNVIKRTQKNPIIVIIN